MRLLRPLPRSRATLLALAGLVLVAAGCSRRDPAGPAVAAQQLALGGEVAVAATIDVPDSRAPGAALRINATLTNRSNRALHVAIGSSSCAILVRLLPAAPGAGASATVYDDFQRPCTRDLRVVTLPAGGSQTLHHQVPLAAIAAWAPKELQAHIGMRLEQENVLLFAGPFTLP